MQNVQAFQYIIRSRKNCYWILNSQRYPPITMLSHTHLCFYVGCIFYGNLFFVGSGNQYVALSFQKIFFSHLKHGIENHRGYCLYQVRNCLDYTSSSQQALATVTSWRLLPPVVAQICRKGSEALPSKTSQVDHLMSGLGILLPHPFETVFAFVGLTVIETVRTRGLE